MEKEIYKGDFSKSKDLGFQHTELLGDSKDHNEIKDVYGICNGCKKYEEKMANEKEKFDVSIKGIRWCFSARGKTLRAQWPTVTVCV